MSIARLWRARATHPPMDRHSLLALAAMLLLAQLPHVLHLPAWVSLLGMLLVGLRLWHGEQPQRRLLAWLVSSPAVLLIAILGAALLHQHYGYFFGRDPCVAFLFLLVACKFAELRGRSDSTLLLCLAGFLLLTQYFYSQSILSALVTLPAVFALGNAMAVVQNPTARRNTPMRLRLIARLLLQGAPLAVLLFILFPRLPGPLWSLPDDARATTGLSDSMAPGDIGSLSLSDAVAFRVEFDGRVPSSAERYWRGPVLEAFDGRRWDRVPPRYELDIQGDDTRHVRNAIDYTVILQPHRQRWLFALDQAVSLPTSLARDTRDARPLAHMSDDRQLLRREPVDRLLQYRQRSVPADRHRALRPPDLQSLQLAGHNVRTIAHARALRARLPDDRAFIDAILGDFREQPFHYTLSPPVLGDRPVDEFLFDTRAGFCEHYASAFVVLLRAAGIPARVVTGYQGGEINGDYMIVRQSDAHAWAEAWLDGYWIRIDPTAAVSPLRVEQGLAGALPDAAELPAMARLAPGWMRQWQLRWDAVNHAWQRTIVDFNDATQARFWQRIGLPTPSLWQLTTLLLLAAATWSLWLLRQREPASGGAANHAWSRFERLLAARGIVRHRNETPAAFAHRAGDALPTLAADLRALESLLTRWRFERVDASDSQRLAQAAQRSLRRLRWRLWRTPRVPVSHAVSSPPRAAAD